MGISHRAAEEDRVRTGRAHAALVIDADGSAQGWCQYGSPEELPGTKHKREHDEDAPPPPDWRITCIYGDKKHRGQGIARAALEGALDHRPAGGQRAADLPRQLRHQVARPELAPLAATTEAIASLRGRADRSGQSGVRRDEMSLIGIWPIALARTAMLVVIWVIIPGCDASSRLAAKRRSVAPRAGGNEPGTGSVVPDGRSCLVCSCHLHARGERCCGRAASGI